MSRRGGAAIAMAPTTRWRMPPESWGGKARSRSAGEGMRTEASSEAARSVSARPRSPVHDPTRDGAGGKARH